MVWQLVLAHFLADYPLQPDWMARSKHRPGVLLLHIAVHLLTLVALTLPAVVWWPYLLVLAAAHLAIDILKNWAAARYPRWNVPAYFADQALHLLSILLVSRWALGRVSPARLALPARAAVVLTAFLLVTYVYLISERVVMNRRAAPDGLAGRVWARMFIRGALLALLLLGFDPRLLALSGLSSVMISKTVREDLRVLALDALFVLVTAALVIWINSMLL